MTRDGIEPAAALAAARAAQGHVGRARRLALDASAAARRADVLRVPLAAVSLGPALSAAASLVRTAEDEAKAVTEGLDEPERSSLRRAFGEGSTGKGVAKAMRGMAGALKDLEDRQKSRATRVKRDTLDQALLDLAVFYRDVLMLQLGADVELANGDREPDLRAGGRLVDPGGHPAPPAGHHALPRTPVAERSPAAGRRGHDALPGRRLSSRASLAPRFPCVPYVPRTPRVL